MQLFKKIDMDRRKALRNLGILTGGIVLLPSCEFSKEKISFALNNLQVTEAQGSLLKEIVSTLIPEGDLPGAGSLQVHDFVWVMVDDCMEKERQDSYIRGLNEFDSYIKKTTEKPFASCSNEERLLVLSRIAEDPAEESAKVNDDVKLFFNTTKELTIFGYMRSEYIMTEVMPYTLIPGSYGPCETVDNTKRINVNG